MLDLWRQVVHELELRGGIKDNDDAERLSVVWQKAHQRAHRGETRHEKLMRRGNDAADKHA